MKRIIEIIEIGLPKSLVQYENEPISSLIDTGELENILNKQLNEETRKDEEGLIDFYWLVENFTPELRSCISDILCMYRKSINHQSPY